MEKVLVSACLLGISCKYDGTDNRSEPVIGLMKHADLIPCCAEIMGGLTTPRDPAEICGDRVLTVNGKDVTRCFTRGAEEVFKLAKLYGCRYAVLKERSPSCGAGTVYDGSFTGTKISGNGVAAELLSRNGVIIYNENQIQEIIKELTKQEQLSGCQASAGEKNE